MVSVDAKHPVYLVGLEHAVRTGAGCWRVHEGDMLVALAAGDVIIVVYSASSGKCDRKVAASFTSQ